MNQAAKDKGVTLIQAVNQALTYAMEKDPKVLMFGEDVADPEDGGVVGCTAGLSTKFGEARCRSTPITEQAIIGAAIGAAIGGYKPVAEIMLMNFTTVAMDMLVNHAAKLRFMSGGQTHVPITVRMMTGAGLQSGGQHSDYVENWFTHTAGLKVVMPSTPADAYGLLLSCIDDPDPCIFIENTPSYWVHGTPPVAGQKIPLSKANVTREGKDVTLIAWSRTANEALGAAAALEKDGISAEVIDLRTLQPWDKATVLKSVAKTGRAVVAHEAIKNFGPGGEIASVIHEECWDSLKAPVARVGGPTCPVPFSKPLEDAFTTTAPQIAAAAKAVVARGGKKK